MSGQRVRLARLEAQRGEAQDLEVIGFFEADPDAGLWVETAGQRTYPMTPEEAQRARENRDSGGVTFDLGPLPGKASKIAYGLKRNAP